MNEVHASPTTRNAQVIHPTGEQCSPASDLVEAFRQYARERPDVVALWCLGIGFVLGWKLKIW